VRQARHDQRKTACAAGGGALRRQRGPNLESTPGLILTSSHSIFRGREDVLHGTPVRYLRYCNAGHRAFFRTRTRVAPDREGAAGGDRGQCKVRSRVCSGDRCLQRGLGLASGGESNGIGGATHGRRYACPETLVATALIAIFQRSGLVGAVLRALATRALASRRRACVAIRLRFSRRACGSRRHGS
jgi:hypothetical protein